MTETDIARLTRERDEARERERLARLVAEQQQERAESLSRELLDAMQARDSYRASAELRVGMRREFEELLGVSDTTVPETFEAGLVRLRELLAAEAKAERLKFQVEREIVFLEEEAATGVSFYEATFTNRAQELRAVLAEVGG